MHLDELVQIVGALPILAGFVGSQFGLLDPHSRLYLALNQVGAVVLAMAAAAESDWGFLLLEGAWALVSAWSLVQLLRSGPPAPAH